MTIDACQQYRGVWLDRGELERRWPVRLRKREWSHRGAVTTTTTTTMMMLMSTMTAVNATRSTPITRTTGAPGGVAGSDAGLSLSPTSSTEEVPP